MRGMVSAVALALAIATTASARPAPPPVADAAPIVSFREIMVPARDGVPLQTVILAPVDQKGPLPIILVRTPYGVPDKAWTKVPGSFRALAPDGYIFVFQSMRGRFKSGGTFTMSTAVHPGDPKTVDEATDAYDTIDWLVKNVPGNTGKVGMWGISYPGFAAAVSLAHPHPALKAVAPMAAWYDYWLSDDLHRNGALRLTYATEWIYELQHTKEMTDIDFGGDYDAYDWYLKKGTAGAIDQQVFHGSLPMYTALLDHPNHDAFYTSQNWIDALVRTTVPTLNVAGYWDQEDPYGSWKIFQKQQANDPDHLAMMVAGPWAHGWWSRPGTDFLGRIRYGVDSAGQYQRDIEAPFFRYWLHGQGTKPVGEIRSFRSGSWDWHEYAQWPPKPGAAKSLYLMADGTLSFDPPRGAGGCRDYVSDPANPVPFRPRPISPTYPRPEWTWWESEDQRFVDHRPDVLSYESAPLKADLIVTGTVAAKLFAGTSGTDSDFVVKLIDVYPPDAEKPPADPKLGDYYHSLNGYQLPIAMEIKRGRFLASDTDPKPLVPGKVVAWEFGMRNHDHVFKAGHRIMVQVQSSWFPVIERNPQRFVPNIARANPADFVKATQTVCSTPAQASRIELPVGPA